nr:hypothetical protein [Tanacetum cinerariifolium]
MEIRLMVNIVKDVLFSERNLKKICLHIALKREFSKILPSHPMTIPTLSMLLKSHLLSIKTPEGYNSLNDNIISELPPYSAVTPTEPIDSRSMGDEHLDTILATESDEFIKSCVENLVPNPSESEGENGCDVLAGFTTFSNVLFDDDYDSDSSDDQSLFDEDVQEKIYLNPLFDEEIIPMEIDQHSFNVESDLIESMPNHDSSIIISLLLYDNSSPRPPEEIVTDISNADIESFSPSPIPNKDSDSHMEEIDLYFNLDDPMPPGERDIPILEELLDNYSLSLPTNESYHFDIPLPYRPPTKPPNGNTGTLNIKMMGDVSDQKVPIPNLTITRILNQEKSPDLLSHLGFEDFQPSAECPMIINGKNIPLLDVPLFNFYPLDQLKSDFYEFLDELAHNISPLEYDCFCFKDEPNSGDFTMDVVEDTFPTREPRVHDALLTHPTLQLNLDFILSSVSLFTYVVWIFLPFLSYSVAP